MQRVQDTPRHTKHSAFRDVKNETPAMLVSPGDQMLPRQIGIGICVSVSLNVPYLPLQQPVAGPNA